MLSTFEGIDLLDSVLGMSSPRALSGADQARLAEAHVLTSKLFQVVHRAQADFEAVAGEFGLTALQARTLLWLVQPCPMGSLAKHLSCDASNVTGLADRLQRLGLVERVPGADRRIKLLSLTPSGTETRAKLAKRVGAGSTVSARLSATQRRQLSKLLDELLA